MRRTQFSIRTLILLTLAAAVAFFTFPHVTRYFSSDTKLEFPDFEQWERDFGAAKLDRLERENRLRNGLDTVADAMNRFVSHDFLRPEKLEGVSGWIMTAESGGQIHRATLQRQSRLFESLGADAVPGLVKWLGHEQIEIRYIASHALERITGVGAPLPSFASLTELDENGWLANARAEYENWIKLDGESEIAR